MVTTADRTTTRGLVRAHVAASSWGHLLRYGGPGKASDVVEHLGEPIVQHRYRHAVGRAAPSATTVLTASEASDMRGLLTGSLPTIGAAIDDYVSALATACQQLSHLGSSTPRSTVSERVAVRVGRHYAQTPACALDLDEVVAEVVQSLLRPSALSKGAFRDRYAAHYATMWQTQGHAAYLAHPPASVLVGSNDQPPLVVEVTENWTVGTDRSVYGRYLLYFKESARGAHEEFRGHDPHGVALLEVGRVCQRYGLARRVNHVIVASLASGLRVDLSAPQARETAAHILTRWRSGAGIAVAPDETHGADFDTELAAAAGAQVARWAIDAPSVRHDTETFRTLVNQDELLTRFVVRKVWMRLHGQERAEAAPPTRDDVSFWVTSALNAAVWEGLAAYQRADGSRPDGWTAGLDGSTEGRRVQAEAAFVAAHGESPHAFVERTNRTLAMIAERPALARLVREPSPNASEEYAVQMSLVAGPSWADRYLAWAEVQHQVSAYLEGDADDGDQLVQGRGAR